MGNNLIRTVEYGSCQDLANCAFADAVLWRLVGAGLTLSSPHARRVSRSRLGASPSIFGIRRMRSFMALSQPVGALFPALANQPRQSPFKDSP